MYTKEWEDNCEGIEVNHSRHIKTTSRGRHTKKKLPDGSKKYSPFACALLTFGNFVHAYICVFDLYKSSCFRGTSFCTYRLIQHHLYGLGVLPVEHRASSLSPAAASEKPFRKVEKSTLESIF